MDYFYLEKLCKEFNENVRKKRIREVYLHSSKVSIKLDELYLNFYTGTPNALFISNKSITDKEFLQLSFLKGLFIRKFYLPRKDRVLFVELLKLLPSGKHNFFYLVFEVTGKNANFLVLNENKEIIYILRKPKSSVRILETGESYLFPPLEKKPFSELKFGKVTVEGIEKNLFKFVEGISPLNSKEIAFLFKKSGSLDVAYKEFMKKHETSKEAYLYFEDGKPKYLTTFPYESLSHLKFKVFSGDFSFSSAWENFYRLVVEKQELESLKRKIISDLNSKIENLLEQVKELSDIDKLEKRVKELQYWGNLLKYNLSKINTGVNKVNVVDYSTGKTVKIPIEPSLSPKENLKRIFNLYKKEKRKLDFARKKLPDLKEKLEKLYFIKSFVEKAHKVEDILTFTTPKKRKKEKELNPFKIFTLPSGRKIFVGRNDKENEFLSLKAANPWDVWFHVKNTPGSHVLLKLQKGEEPTEEDIRLSASAAVYFSKGRDSGKVLVDFTRAKNLKKPPGTPQGFITYKGEKTISVSSEEFEKLVKAPEGAEVIGWQ